MRIAWFTPFAEGSEVARFSAMVTRELARHAGVDIWHPPVPHLYATGLRTIAMPRRGGVTRSMLEAYDLAVYNLGGDEADSRITEAACAVPGLVILHGPVPAVVARRALGAIPACLADQSGAGSQPAAASQAARNYAASLLASAETLLAEAPVLRCIDAMAARLAEMGVEAGAPAVDRLAREAGALFGWEQFGDGLRISAREYSV